MVLFVSCPTSSQVPPHSYSSTTTQDFYYELTTSSTTTAITMTTTCSNGGFVDHKKSNPQPIPTRNGSNCGDGDHSTSPLERLPSPLASSAESVDSIKSSCSSRSSAERGLERAQRHQLLDLGLTKLRAQPNMPMRKHLLVFNCVKALQRDLDTLDDEELYCSLMGLSNENAPNLVSAMEVDDCSGWVREPCFDSGAPLQQEEQQMVQTGNLEAAAFGNINNGLDMETMELLEDAKMFPAVETKTWSWSNESSDANSDVFGNWLNSNSFSNNESNFSDDSLSLFGLGSNATWSRHSTCESAHRFDLWGAADPLGNSRFDLQHLFPSQQLCLQA